MTETAARKLTPKQRLFVEAYLRCWNATVAAGEAGYKGDKITLAAVGYKLLRIAHVAQKISERIQASCMSTDEALKILAQQARFDPGKFLVLDGEYPTVDISLMRQAGLTSMIKSIAPTRYGAKIEFYDSQAAIEKILKAGGAYKDQGDGINVTVPVTIQRVAGFDNV